MLHFFMPLSDNIYIYIYIYIKTNFMMLAWSLTREHYKIERIKLEIDVMSSHRLTWIQKTKSNFYSRKMGDTSLNYSSGLTINMIIFDVDMCPMVLHVSYIVTTQIFLFNLRSLLYTYHKHWMRKTSFKFHKT